MDWLIDSQIWVGLLTLTALEIVLGIDNLVFIAVLASRPPPHRQNRARRVGLALALITRLALLASISWIIGLTQPLFDLFGQAVSWRDIVLMSGGLFSSTRAPTKFTIGWKARGPRRPQAAGEPTSAA